VLTDRLKADNDHVPLVSILIEPNSEISFEIVALSFLPSVTVVQASTMASNGFPREAVVDNLKFNGTEYPGFVSSTVARKSAGHGDGGLLLPAIPERARRFATRHIVWAGIIHQDA